MSSNASIVASIFDVAHAMEGEFERIVAASSLSAQSGAALLQLGRNDGMKMQDLALALACDAGNLSGTIDRLEEASLVERVVTPADRRVRVLRLTSRGRKIVEKLEDAVAQTQIQKRLDALPCAERERFAATLAKLKS